MGRQGPQLGGSIGSLAACSGQEGHSGGNGAIPPRNLARVQKWAEAAGLQPWSLDATDVALFLRDAGGRGPSVPKASFASLLWAKEIFQFPWPPQDPLVEAQRCMSSKQTEEQRQQASPLTRAIVDCLLNSFFVAAGAHDSAIVVAIGFVLAQAFGCLRWADLQRSTSCSLSRDAFTRNRGGQRRRSWRR